MLLPLESKSSKSVWTWRIALVLVLGAAGAFWIGADRISADATRPIEWQGQTKQNAIAGKTFRVAAFNIHGGKGMDRRLDLQRIADVIEKAKPDFVGLNEVHGANFGSRNQAEELGEYLGLSALFVPTERRFWRESFGNGLLTNVATTPVHRLPLPCTQGKKYRTASLTSFNAGGTTVRVLCVHLDRVKDREVQLNRVFSLFRDLETPAILMGDLNTFPNDPLLAKWLKDSDIKDAVHEHLGERDPARRIDWIFTRGLKTTLAGCVQNDASDHPMVWAELNIPE